MADQSFWETFTLLAAGMPATVRVTVLALLIGLVGGLPVMALRRVAFWPVRMVAIAYIEIVRGVPPLAWIFIAFFGLPRLGIMGMGPEVSATIALGLVSSAYLAEIYRAGLDSVPRGQLESSQALGMPQVAIYRRILGPQAVPLVIPPAGTFGVGLIKESALASIIGVTDVTFRAYIEVQRTFEGFHVFVVAAFVYLLICIPAAILSRYLDRVYSRRGRVAAR